MNICVYGCGSVGTALAYRLLVWTVILNLKDTHVFLVDKNATLLERDIGLLMSKGSIHHPDRVRFSSLPTEMDVVVYCASVPRAELPPKATMQEIMMANAKPLAEFITFLSTVKARRVLVVSNPVEATTTVLAKHGFYVKGVGMMLDLIRLFGLEGQMLATGVGFHGKPFAVVFQETQTHTTQQTAEAANAGFEYVKATGFTRNVIYSIVECAYTSILLNTDQYPHNPDIGVAHNQAVFCPDIDVSMAGYDKFKHVSMLDQNVLQAEMERQRSIAHDLLEEVYRLLAT